MSSATQGVDTAGHILTRVYTTPDGRTVIEQSSDAVVTLTAEQILKVISELRACYDYCAAWKQSRPEQDDLNNAGVQP
jgi:hypothetical protein